LDNIGFENIKAHISEGGSIRRKNNMTDITLEDLLASKKNRNSGLTTGRSTFQPEISVRSA
jgi:hypothetical protein